MILSVDWMGVPIDRMGFDFVKTHIYLWDIWKSLLAQNLRLSVQNASVGFPFPISLIMRLERRYGMGSILGWDRSFVLRFVKFVRWLLRKESRPGYGVVRLSPFLASVYETLIQRYFHRVKYEISCIVYSLICHFNDNAIIVYTYLSSASHLLMGIPRHFNSVAGYGRWL